MRLAFVLSIALILLGLPHAQPAGSWAEGYATRSNVQPGDVFSIVLTVRSSSAEPANVTIAPPAARPAGFSWAVSSASNGSVNGDRWSGVARVNEPAQVVYRVTVAKNAPAAGRDVAIGFRLGSGQVVAILVRVGLAEWPAPQDQNRVYFPAFYL